MSGIKKFLLSLIFNTLDIYFEINTGLRDVQKMLKFQIAIAHIRI